MARKLPAVKPAYVMKMNAGEVRSEREQVIQDAIKRFHWVGSESVKIIAGFAWDAAVDAAADRLKLRGYSYLADDVLALKGDRNAS